MLGKLGKIALENPSTRRCFFSTRTADLTKESYKFVVAGGGAGGLSIASHLARHFPNQVAVIEPSDVHYYQPLWTLVGGGVKNVEDSMKPMSEVLPNNSKWIKDKAAEFHPDNNTVLTQQGHEAHSSVKFGESLASVLHFIQQMPVSPSVLLVKYEYLVVALGLQLDFHKVKGLPEALGTDGVGCNYSVKTVNDTFNAIKNFSGGNAIFTLPATPVKCQGAPQKIMYLAEDYFQQNGVRQKTKVTFNTALPFMFAVKKYCNVLERIVKERDIQVNFERNLIEINASRKEATFEILSSEGNPKETETYQYDMIHVTPPMGPPDVLKGSPISDANGFVDTNKDTMQHKKYRNIFGIGDCTNLPISKTAAAVAGQSKALRRNIMEIVQGRSPEAKYDGYTSCPLITGYNKCVLAEFNYNAEPMETFPFDQGKERRTMYHLKADVMPDIYWHGLIKGYWGGPGPFRKALHLGLKK